MTAIATDKAKQRDLQRINDRLDAIRAHGEQLARETGLLFAEVWQGDLWQYEMILADADTNKYRACKSFIEWADVRHDVRKSRAFQLKDFGLLARSTGVENEHQARQLAAKIKEDRQAEQRALDPEEAVERSRKAERDADLQLRRFDLEDACRAVGKKLKSGRDRAMASGGDFPDAFFSQWSLERCIDYCDEQLGLEAA